MTVVNHHLKANTLYRGGPAKKFGENSMIIDKKSIESEIFQSKPKIDEDKFLRSYSKELSAPFLFYIVNGVIIIGFSFIIPGMLFFPYLFCYYFPTLFINPFSLLDLLDLTFYY